MKLAVTGKGGVGKTTLSSLLVQYFSKEGKRVIAVDADPDANFGSALGFENADSIVPIADMESLIEERTGAKPGGTGTFFKINPKVDDLPEKLSQKKGNISLMVMGKGKKGGTGCMCPENTLLKNLITHLVLYEDDVVILDMEAGIEHMGRGTADAVDMFIVVVEPGKRSIETAFNIEKLARDLGVKKIGVVGNKIRKQSDEIAIKEKLHDMTILGFLPYDEELIETDLDGGAVNFNHENLVIEIIKNLKI
jgi:CO dehydrogenase maturation factor